MATTQRRPSPHSPSVRISLSTIAPTLLLVALLAASSWAQDLDLESRSLASQGIVVPKRTALIVGLNQQFKLRAAERPPAASNSSSSLGPQPLHWPLSRLQPRRPLLGAPASAPSGGQQQQQGLYLDRRQQEILAANPNLLNPSSLSAGLGTRSAADPLGQQPSRQQLTTTNRPQSDSPPRPLDNHESHQQQQQQLYRGYSLIELDVKSEQDRHFVRDLYGNLSAALNEQAQNAQAISVSPYVDVDFWSFRQALNDQIDIMVSPKSRSFILGQLNRAKIRHRIKIEDIQARLDQQQQLSGASQQPAAGLSQGQADSLTGRAGNPTAIDMVNQSQLNGRQSIGGGGGGGSSKPLNDSQFFDNYQRLADITQWLESLVERSRDIGQIKVIGRSSQGRYLRVLKLGYDQQDGAEGSPLLAPPDSAQLQANRNQPAGGAQNATLILESFFRKQAATRKLGSIWLDGGTHAREWISPSTVLYMAHRLADNHSRCRRFFEALKMAAQAQAQSAAASLAEQSRQARRYQPAQLEPDQSLVEGINEINSSLLGGKPLKQLRPRTELERTLEQLAKSPQEVAGEHGCDLELDQLLRRYTFFMMPVLNPDGYEYSHTHNRLWRKTRSTSNHPIYRHFCLGADPNRNYDARHGSTGSSTHPCSQTFAGSVPFTEPETRHHSNFVYANRLGMKMYISFHSYSQMILLPFSHSKQLAPDHKDLESVGLAAAKAIEQTHGTVYRVGPSASILYTASGTASDWAYEKAGIKYSYTMELRDTGTYGFLLPRQQILPTGEETFNGLLAMIGQMEKNDNLLTSKSTLFAAANQSAPAGSLDPAANPEELYGPSWKNRGHSKPGAQLESVLAAGSWPQPQPAEGLNAGARDRKASTERPAAEQPAEGSWLSAADSLELADEELTDTGLADEPDAGYAFEGEGELMEPTLAEGSLQMRADRDQRESGRGRIVAGGQQMDRSRRAIARSAGLSPSGRSYINSPLQQQQQQRPDRTSSSRRRESSEDLAGFGRATVARRL